jgi:hypothetical protein
MKNEADRKHAHTHYDLYLAAALLEHGEDEEAEKTLRAVRAKLRPIDRLAKAEATALLIKARRENRGTFAAIDTEDIELRNELFSLLPSHIRYHGMKLPIEIRYDKDEELLNDIAQDLLGSRFETPTTESKKAVRYRVFIAKSNTNRSKVTLELREKVSNTLLARVEEFLTDSNDDYKEAVNNFIAKVFRHTVDPPSEPTPALDILKGIF